MFKEKFSKNTDNSSAGGDCPKTRIIQSEVIKFDALAL